MALWKYLAPLLVVALVGCDGVIGGGGPGGNDSFSGPGGDVGAIGAQVMHRLNRTEYRNTVRDLLGTQLDPAASFPADDVSLGFDNIAQVLTVSPLQVELYDQAAEDLTLEALTTGIRDSIVFCDPNVATCRDDIFRELASRAWRRPTTDAEIVRLQQLFDVALSEGEGVEQGLELAIRGILLSPHFIYRPELDDDPTSTEPHSLNDYELASRLSYFLWSTMPDAALFDAAASGRLRDEAGLRAEVDRMLSDPKAQSLVDNFAGQWLRIRSLDDHVPDYATFPEWDESLKNSMSHETKLFFGDFLRGDVPMDQLLLTDFTYMNDRLAAHYGLPFDLGPELERVSLGPTDSRFGLLTLGSLLTVTSAPTRTSPVKRGVWILEQLLCSEPPPPPPGVEGLPQDGMSGGTLREQLEQHRADPTCASCHNVMDPLGLGLEHYDGIGAYRTEDQGFPVDASGELVTGETFIDGREMAALIQQDTRFDVCVVEKLFLYALGRPMGSSEHPFLEEIAESFAQSGAELPELIKLIVTSEPFRTRRGTLEESQ
ncbi:MAG: DUF1592 domain-containing protein [Myxococcales bacterium]|nr:DUF1592 domain-containing protein [Myxococcales bacterium]